MADELSLESMGRELKCPICLSLLDSAASLTCNHVFCKLCIHKSMKLGSNCPVCKVPYHRREIRPAPHMDNLVKIYKSMEIAYGINLFVTQNPSTTTLSEKQTEGDEDVGAQESGLETPKTVKNQKKKRPLSKNLSKPKSKTSGRNRVKPFFLSNKRVQVPQSPDNETPLRQAKDELRKMKMTIEVFDNRSSSSNEHPPSKEKQHTNLSPFFWLREDIDQEKPSQEVELDHLTGTPVKPPSFSDINDLDDDVYSNMPPKENTLEKGNNMDLFDSEMFDWTQRACSPELCSSPATEAMVGAADEFDRRLENLEEHLKCGVVSNELYNCSSSGSETDDNQNGSVLSCKRGRKLSNRSHTKRRKENLGQACDFELALGSSKDYCSLKATCVGSPDLGLPDEVTDLASKLAILKSKRGIGEEKELNKSKKKYKSARQSNTVSAEQGRGEEEILVTPAMVDEVVVSKDSKQNKSSSVPDNSEKKRYSKEMRCEIKEKVSEDGFCRKKVKGKSNVHPEDVAQAEGNNNGLPCGNDLEGSLTIGKVLPQTKLPTLRKCDAISISCAFCQSTEETEASGEMVHYSSGRPVLENYSAGSLLHVHRNCTEWAPNVYFEGDIVVNLEEELSRSRRIKCSLCGIKGAALGCYEKTCRKSFHVTCAMRLKTCRWDNDHFVILCPLHASLKLPTELSMRKPRKQKSNKIRKTPNRQSQLAVCENTSRHVWSLSLPSEKIALCCSGLSTTEKETVSEFAKASGVVIMTTWSSTVTHVIASVDENEACRRTLKVLTGILDGRWILSIKWVQACMKAMKLVDEDSYEISCDIHGVKNGPRFGRLRLLNKEPKLFTGYKFYLSGDFAPSYKGYLQDLVIAAGGTILNRKPISESNDMASSSPSTIIVYSVELPEKSDLRERDTILASRKSDAEALATSTGSAVANNLWVLNCIAGHKLLDL